MLSAAVAVAACSSSNANSSVNVGPSFPSQTLYGANSNQDSISIYNKDQKTGTGPAYQIGGSNTTLNGPQYIAFDKSNNLWTSNYNSGTGAGTIVEIEALATGNVLPLQTSSIAGRPRGIAIDTSTTTLYVADVNPTTTYPNQLLLFTAAGSIGSAYETIAGPKTLLNVPAGVALDSSNNVYVSNLQGGGSIEKFVLPTASPTPKTSPTPTASPTPTPNPSASPTTSPSPSPTPTPVNIAPQYVISGTNTGITKPSGVAVDTSGNIYVANTGPTPSILIFAPQKAGDVNIKPARTIAGSATGLFTPTDVKVDTDGEIYVADATKSGAGVIYVYASGANGNVAPIRQYTSPGAVAGLGLIP